MTWQEMFDQNKHQVGHAMQEALRSEALQQGYADHGWQPKAIYGRAPRVGTYLSRTECAQCGAHEGAHNVAMLAYEDFIERIPARYLQIAAAGFRVACEATTPVLEYRNGGWGYRSADMDQETPTAGAINP